MIKIIHQFSRFFVLILLLAIGLSKSALAQPTDKELEEAMANASFKEKWEVANHLFEEKMYYHSLKIWKNLAEDQPENANVNYHIGRCYLESNTEKTQALPFLEKVKGNIDKRWNPYSHLETKAPIDAWFYLGKAYHLDYQFDQAIQAFTTFQSEAHRKHYLQDQAKLEITMCNNAKDYIANKTERVRIENIGSTINSEYSDFSPVLSLDEKVLYFTSRRLRNDSSNFGEINPNDGKYFEDVYVSYKDRDGKWQAPKVIDDLSYPNRNEATIGVSADGQTLYVYIDDEGDGNIYAAELLDTVFGDLVYQTAINSTSWETHATLSADGNTLYFVSDRETENSMGGRDIYRVVKLPNGEWSKPLNLGPPINTPFDEDSPFLQADGKTLFYSSNGPKSMGGFDIFQSELDEETNSWNVPKNLGYPINTVDDDVFFIVSADGKKGYYSSVHEVMSEGHGNLEGYGEKDIYEVIFEEEGDVDVAILKGYISTSDNEPLPSGVTILAYDLTEGTAPLLYRPRQTDGGYVLNLKPCHEYKVEYLLNESKFYETQFDVPCNSGYQVIHKEIFLNTISMTGSEEDGDTTDTTPVMVGNTVRWKVIDAPFSLSGQEVTYYDGNKTELGKVKIGDDDIFFYKKEEGQTEFAFGLETMDGNICDKVCIAMIDSTNTIIGYAMRGEDCSYSYKPIEQRWMVMKDGNPYNKPGTKVTFLDDDGNISFEERLGCDGMFEYHELGGNQSPIFLLDADDPGLCDEMKVVLVDENNNVIGETVRDEKCRFIYKREETVDGDIKPASYEKYFGYNQKSIAQSQKEFKDFLDGAAAIAKQRGYVNIEVESSASKVPTSTFKNNVVLSKKRAETAKSNVISGLKALGVSSSMIKFVSVNSQVLGPNYNNDYIKNRKTYEKYQFVKVYAK